MLYEPEAEKLSENITKEQGIAMDAYREMICGLIATGANTKGLNVNLALLCILGEVACAAVATSRKGSRYENEITPIYMSQFFASEVIRATQEFDCGGDLGWQVMDDVLYDGPDGGKDAER